MVRFVGLHFGLIPDSEHWNQLQLSGIWQLGALLSSCWVDGWVTEIQIDLLNVNINSIYD